MKKPKLPGARTTIKYGGKRLRVGSMTMPRAQAGKLEEAEEPMGMINGKRPTSSYEWHIARALWHYGWEFEYLLTFRGGHQMRGGLELDFLVKTIPAATAVPVDGGYWHRNAKHERYHDTEIIKALRDEGYKVRNEVIHALDKDCVTFDTAKQFIHRHFGRA